MSRIKTNLTGVYYRDSITNNKSDKTYYITYKNEQNKAVELKIGKYSEGYRESYCNQMRNEIITKIRTGEEPPVAANKKKRTILCISVIVDDYFNQRDEGKSKQTDISHYNIYLFPFFKNYDFEQINKNDILKFSKFLRSYISTSTKRPLADKSVNNILNLLKTIIKYGFKNDLLKNDFSKYINLLDIDNARERFLTKEEINILYESAKDDETLYILFKLALNTGGRLATILNIHKKDIDFTHDLLTLKDFKNNSTYKAFITSDLKALLEKRTSTLNLSDKLFPSNPDRRLRNMLDELFNDGIDENDRKNKVVFHSLRHTFASHLAINKTPIFTIQKLMNHKDIKMTLRYAKLNSESGREAVEGLNL